MSIKSFAERRKNLDRVKKAIERIKNTMWDELEPVELKDLAEILESVGNNLPYDYRW